MSEWIKWGVQREQRPASDQRCIVFVGKHGREPIVIADYVEGCLDFDAMWSWDEGEIGFYSDQCRTHCDAKGTFWMPLPRHPE